jgi:hypothetical protein
MKERVKDYPDYVKIDKTYVVNVNQQKYRDALKRKNAEKKYEFLENRINSLEEKLIKILDLLENK